VKFKFSFDCPPICLVTFLGGSIFFSYLWVLHNFTFLFYTLQPTSANHWLRSFVSGRPQYVTVCGECTNPSTCVSGITQGSVLGHLLFSVYGWRHYLTPDSVSPVCRWLPTVQCTLHQAIFQHPWPPRGEICGLNFSPSPSKSTCASPPKLAHSLWLSIAYKPWKFGTDSWSTCCQLSFPLWAFA